MKQIPAGPDHASPCLRSARLQLFSALLLLLLVTGDLRAGGLEVDASAAFSGAFGLKVTVGQTCLSPDTLRIEAPPPTVQGDFEACDELEAAGVQVVSPGASFTAGNRIALEDEFSVAQGVQFTALIDKSLVTLFPYVWDESPASEVTYNARFLIRVDDLLLGDSELLEHFVGYSGAGPAEFKVLLTKYLPSGSTRLSLAARLDAGGFVTLPAEEEVVIPDGWNRLELSWRAGPGDGQLLASVNGASFFGLNGLTNSLGRIDLARWGAAQGLDATTTGTMHLDGFESWR